VTIGRIEPHPASIADFDDLWRSSTWQTRLAGPALPAATTWVALICGLAAADIVGNVVVDGPLQVPTKLAMVLVAVAAARWSGISWAAMGMSWSRLARGLLVGGAAAAVIAAVVALGVLLPALAGLFDTGDAANDDAGERAVRLGVMIPLGTVVFEEVLFRSVTFAALLAVHSVRGALIGQALLFGLWHLVPAISGADGNALVVAGSLTATVVATGVAGLGFGWLRLRGNSVAAPAVAHLASNSFGYLVAALFLDT